MKANIDLLDSIMIKGNGAELANNFERIGDAEKTQWLPYYYAAYCTVTQAFTEKDNSKKDAIADRSQQLIDKAEAILGKENSETDVIKSMIATAHMMVDPQSRYMTYGPSSSGFIEKSNPLTPQTHGLSCSKRKINSLLRRPLVVVKMWLKNISKKPMR